MAGGLLPRWGQPGLEGKILFMSWQFIIVGLVWFDFLHGPQLMHAWSHSLRINSPDDTSRYIKTMLKGMWAEFQGTMGMRVPQHHGCLEAFTHALSALCFLKVLRIQIQSWSLCACLEQQIARALLFRGRWNASSRISCRIENYSILYAGWKMEKSLTILSF